MRFDRSGWGCEKMPLADRARHLRPTLDRLCNVYAIDMVSILEVTMKVLFLIGRILFGGYFL
jgi:hypothetical protein